MNNDDKIVYGSLAAFVLVIALCLGTTGLLIWGFIRFVLHYT